MTAAPEPLLYLCRRDVERASRAVDAVAAVREALVLHATGRAVVPTEAYLEWGTRTGETARSINMPGAIDGGVRAVGTKIINANPANPGRGLPRASGVTVLFDVDSARPLAILEAARISALRTAAVSVLAAEALGAHPLRRLALIGAGEIGAAHLELIAERLPELTSIRVYDSVRDLAAALAGRDERAEVAASAEDALRGAGFVVAATTATEAYIPSAWLSPGALAINVSLDDFLPDVFLRADRLIVDDWQLVADDRRRLLGRLVAEGRVKGTDPTLGEVLAGLRRGRRGAGELVVVNPFGMAIEDVALAARIVAAATALGLGTYLER